LAYGKTELANRLRSLGLLKSQARAAGIVAHHPSAIQDLCDIAFSAAALIHAAFLQIGFKRLFGRLLIQWSQTRRFGALAHNTQ
jgi:hypothetical protein